MNCDSQHEPKGADEWDSWLQLQAPRLLLFARQQTRSEADAHDLVQEAVVEAWELTKGAPPGAGLVFSIIRRRAIDLGRREDRRLKREAAALAGGEPDWFAPEIEDRERGRLLQDALGRLPEIQRSVVTLKVWGGLTFAEIAETLDIPANTAASRYRYALEELRQFTKEVFA